MAKINNAWGVVSDKCWVKLSLGSCHTNQNDGLVNAHTNNCLSQPGFVSHESKRQFSEFTHKQLFIHYEANFIICVFEQTKGIFYIWGMENSHVGIKRKSFNNWVKSISGQPPFINGFHYLIPIQWRNWSWNNPEPENQSNYEKHLSSFLLHPGDSCGWSVAIQHAKGHSLLSGFCK